MILFQQSQMTIDIIGLVQNLGFPIAVALICMFFIWQALKYVRVKLDEKDTVITGMIEHSKETHKEIIKTQNKIISTQEKIADTQNEMSHSINNYLITK